MGVKFDYLTLKRSLSLEPPIIRSALLEFVGYFDEQRFERALIDRREEIERNPFTNPLEIYRTEPGLIEIFYFYFKSRRLNLKSAQGVQVYSIDLAMAFCKAMRQLNRKKRKPLLEQFYQGLSTNRTLNPLYFELDTMNFLAAAGLKPSLVDLKGTGRYDFSAVCHGNSYAIECKTLNGVERALHFAPAYREFLRELREILGQLAFKGSYFVEVRTDAVEATSKDRSSLNDLMRNIVECLRTSREQFGREALRDRPEFQLRARCLALGPDLGPKSSVNPAHGYNSRCQLSLDHSGLRLDMVMKKRRLEGDDRTLLDQLIKAAGQLPGDGTILVDITGSSFQQFRRLNKNLEPAVESALARNVGSFFAGAESDHVRYVGFFVGSYLTRSIVPPFARPVPTFVKEGVGFLNPKHQVSGRPAIIPALARKLIEYRSEGSTE